MDGHSMNLEFMKCFIEDGGDYEKMALTLLHSKSGRIFKGIPCAKYRRKVIFFGMGRNDGSGHRVSII